MYIEFIGTPGAGKTTIVEKTREILEKEGIYCVTRANFFDPKRKRMSKLLWSFLHLPRLDFQALKLFLLLSRYRKSGFEKTITKNNLLVVDEAIVTESAEDIIRIHQEMVSKGLEGVMVKKYDTAYVPGRTGWRWVKMKQEESAKAKLADTIDCVVMGYTAGRGKRVSFGLGQFLVGVRDNDEIKTVTKVGTGLTDDQFRELKKRLTGLEVKEKPKNYLVNKLLEPDYWVTAEVVVEIAADELTPSPLHAAGWSVRFPRLVRFRPDKRWDQATTIDELTSINQVIDTTPESKPEVV